MSSPQVITFDYDFSPYGQKIRHLLSLTNPSFTRCLQPTVLPRPTLEKMGITFRRIPILAVGKDVYCDSALITETALNSVAEKKELAASKEDAAYEAFGVKVFFAVLPLVPAQALTENFVKDRKTIFPILERPDLQTLRPSALGEFRANLTTIETKFLGGGSFIGGQRPSVADVHVSWPVRWALESLGVAGEPGFGEDAFPKVHKWLSNLPIPAPKEISEDDAIKAVTGGKYVSASPKVESNDPLGISSGTKVTVESFDAKPGAHIQEAKLVGANVQEVVLELENGIRLHFPRIGYIVRKA